MLWSVGSVGGGGSFAVLLGVPLSVNLGIFGITELPHALNPSAELLHVAQGLLALAAGVAWALPSQRRGE